MHRDGIGFLWAVIWQSLPFWADILGWHNDSECAGAYAVMKRRVHYTDFAVGGHSDPRGSGLHPYLLHLEGVQVSFGLMLKKSPQSGANET